MSKVFGYIFAVGLLALQITLVWFLCSTLPARPTSPSRFPLPISNDSKTSVLNFLQSSDGGLTWTTVYSSSEMFADSIDCSSETTCFMTAFEDNVLLRSKDSGRSWQEISFPNEVFGLTCYRNPANDCYLETYTGTQRVWLRTNNDFQNWQETVMPREVRRQINSGATCPLPQLCFAFNAKSEVFRSQDGGQNWQSSKTDLPAELLPQLTACPTSTDCVAVGISGTVLTTNNAGLSWQNHSLADKQASLYSLTCPQPTACYMFDSKRNFWKSTDLGITWQKISQSAKLTGRFSCPTAEFCVSLGQDKVFYKTTDGGQSWEKSTYKLIEQPFDFVCVNEKVCYALVVN